MLIKDVQIKTTRRYLGCKRQEDARSSALKLNNITWRPYHVLQESGSTSHGNKIIWASVIRKPLFTSPSWLLWRHLYLEAVLRKREQWDKRRKGIPVITCQRWRMMLGRLGLLLSFSAAKQEAGQRVRLARNRGPLKEEFKGVWAVLQDSSPRNDSLGCCQRGLCS